MSQAETSDFSALSDDLVLLIAERLPSKSSSCSGFSTLAAFSCVSRQCARVMAHSCGTLWERACRADFPGLNKLFPHKSIDMEELCPEEGTCGSVEETAKSNSEVLGSEEGTVGSMAEFESEKVDHTQHVEWGPLARLLSECPGHDVNRGQPVFSVDKCNPEALVRKPSRVDPSKVRLSWKQNLDRGATILGRLARGLTTGAFKVFLLQQEECLAVEFVGQTGPRKSFNCLAIFWGFLAGLGGLKEVETTLQETPFVCPFCPSPMGRIPEEYVAEAAINPGTIATIFPEFFCCQNGHLYGIAACDSNKVIDTFARVPILELSARQSQGQTLQSIVQSWARERNGMREAEEALRLLRINLERRIKLAESWRNTTNLQEKNLDKEKRT